MDAQWRLSCTFCSLKVLSPLLCIILPSHFFHPWWLCVSVCVPTTRSTATHTLVWKMIKIIVRSPSRETCCWKRIQASEQCRCHINRTAFWSCVRARGRDFSSRDSYGAGAWRKMVREATTPQSLLLCLCLAVMSLWGARWYAPDICCGSWALKAKGLFIYVIMPS